MIKFGAPVALLLLLGSASALSGDQQSQLVDQLTQPDAQLAPSEVVQRLQQLDKDYYIAGQLPVGRLLALDQADCSKDSLIGLRSVLGLASNLYKQQSNSLTVYLESCERALIVRCIKSLDRLANPVLELGTELIDEINDTRLFEQQLARIPVRELLNGSLWREKFMTDCHKARSVLEPFQLVCDGVKKYQLNQLVLDSGREGEQLTKWCRLFKNCDRLLYLANPYELRW